MTWRADHDAPFWCEENAWHLCADPRIGVDANVLVISSPARAVALWHQRAASPPDAPVIWDYHVIVVATSDGVRTVWDLDTTLGWGVAATTYAARTFLAPVRAMLRPSFRVFTAAEYRERFASDRRHMRDATGKWQQPPPPWPAIGSGHTLDAILDPEDAAYGPWCSLDALRW